MRLLLDTHVLLWWLMDDDRLSAAARNAITDGRNEVFVSSVTITEIAIKQAQGKLDAPYELLVLLEEAGFVGLPLTAAHGVALRDLPPHHRDPFDRMLVAQARLEELDLVTADRALAQYDVGILAG